MKTRQGVLTLLLALSLCLGVVPLAPLSAAEAGGSILARLPAAAYNAAALPATRVLDYGRFVWLELTAAQFARLQASGQPYQAYTEPFTLHLGELSFDPAGGAPDLPAGWGPVRSDGPDLHLVQLGGPTQARWLDDLRAVGLSLIQYVHPFTYIVWGEPGALSRAATLDFVRWTGPFAPAYRVLPQWRDLSDDPVRISAMLVRVADVDGALQAIEALGGQITGRAAIDATFETAKLTIPGAQLQAAARVPGIYSLQLEPTDGGLRGEMSNQINVNNHDAGNLAFPGYQDWLAAAGVDGNGVIIANVDGGVQETHPDLVNRFLTCTGQTCSTTSSSHGTHTAGLMAADGSSGVVDAYGFLRGQGMAPGANLVEQVYSPWFTQPGGMLLLMTDSYNNGASLSGNSWGPSGSPQGYDDDTRQVDVGVRDADPDAAGNQPLSYVLSFMNGNGGYQSQGTPDEAKNIFTIGSTKMQTGSGAQILEIDDLSANTAHGPALDGRTIPHMVAPGCEVDSTVPTNSHGLMCGTSMASPHVSGAVALFIEYYRSLFGVDPSPALIKAAFTPVAHDLAGHDDADGNPLGHPFDSKQGWGRMDTEAVVSPTFPVLYYDNPLIFDNTGEEWTATLSPADPNQPVRLMLVWTDAPGHGLGGSTPAWNNDLDLLVEAGGDAYWGNNFGADGWSAPGGSADYRNNTEGVFLDPTAARVGQFTVRIQAANINSDGIPNQGDDTDQDFALACYNCLAGANFSLSAEPDFLTVCAPDVVTSTIQVGEILTYPHDVTLAVLDVPAGVTAGIAPDVVTPPGQAELTLDVSDATADGNYSIAISGTAELTNVHTTRIGLLVSSSAPGTPLLLDPPDGSANQPLEGVTLQWEPLPQVRNYSLRLDTTPAFDAPLVDVSGIPTGTYTLETTLEPAACYFWQAMGENACGPSPWAEPFRFATARFVQIFLDDVEDGGANWTATGLWHITTDPADPCAEAHSGSSSWYYGQESDCTYNTGSTNSGTLTLAAPLDLSAALAPASLRFWSWEQTEDYGGYDTRQVYLSNNGSTWSQVWDSSNNASAWYQVEIDVSSYVGGDLYIRFEFNTGDSAYNNYRGWYVDDVEVTASLPLSDAPTVLAINPAEGQLGSQTPVTITGESFLPTPIVLLDGTLLLSVTYASSTTLTAVVPPSLAPGLYDLTVINNDCQEDILVDAFQVGCVSSPEATFASDSPVELGETMHFTSVVTGTGLITYTWDLGDDLGTSAEPNPSYTYGDIGSFTVTLSVEDICGLVVVSDVVEVLCFLPAGEVSSNSPVTLGQPVYLAATVSGTGPLTYTWDLGGPGAGSGLDTPTPVFTYTAAGDYPVTLVVDGPCGAATFTETVTVTMVDVYYYVYLPLIRK